MPELRRLCGICGRDGRSLYLGRGHPFCFTNRAPLFKEMYIEEHILTVLSKGTIAMACIYFIWFCFCLLYLAVWLAFITITHSGTLIRSGTVFVSRSVGPSDNSKCKLIHETNFFQINCKIICAPKFYSVIIAQTFLKFSV